jgi:hypothetical protein
LPPPAPTAAAAAQTVGPSSAPSQPGAATNSTVVEPANLRVYQKPVSKGLFDSLFSSLFGGLFGL